MKSEARLVAHKKYAVSEKGILRRRASVKRAKDAKRAFVAAHKSKYGCRECGETDSIVLDLHHVSGDKHPRLTAAKYRGALSSLGWDALRAEIAKCHVLCANCHRRETHRLRQES